MMRALRRRPFDNTLWYPFGILVENRYIYKILETMLQTIPLHLLHVVTSICGTKPRPSYSTLCSRLQAMNEALKFFALREWDFERERVTRLRERLAPEDAAVFNLDVKTIDWTSHCEDFVAGARRYLLRERDEDIDRARRRMFK
ncbi:putative fatty acyl-CoA reductase CG5065 isoform X2 [Trichoplusia ni]|nr:putative fatty acyl-CoA reductase CG5065 isoform X2 [Trichoplusia ni]